MQVAQNVPSAFLENYQKRPYSFFVSGVMKGYVRKPNFSAFRIVIGILYNNLLRKMANKKKTKFSFLQKFFENVYCQDGSKTSKNSLTRFFRA